MFADLAKVKYTIFNCTLSCLSFCHDYRPQCWLHILQFFNTYVPRYISLLKASILRLKFMIITEIFQLAASNFIYVCIYTVRICLCSFQSWWQAVYIWQSFIIFFFLTYVSSNWNFFMQTLNFILLSILWCSYAYELLLHCNLYFKFGSHICFFHILHDASMWQADNLIRNFFLYSLFHSHICFYSLDVFQISKSSVDPFLVNREEFSKSFKPTLGIDKTMTVRWYTQLCL